MTEEEAKKMVCCGPPPIGAMASVMAKLAAPGDDGSIIAAFACRGSACMAWRWRREKETAAYLADVQAHMQATGDNFNKATQKVWADKAGSYTRNEGFCGLAGVPS